MSLCCKNKKSQSTACPLISSLACYINTANIWCIF
nr:MAG TPA: hypothetical protein [Caudoviricetes sp.]DAV99107.1 MAG TPA: hypothetical protein [Caudoviricetes sp.]